MSLSSSWDFKEGLTCVYRQYQYRFLASPWGVKNFHAGSEEFQLPRTFKNHPRFLQNVWPGCVYVHAWWAFAYSRQLEPSIRTVKVRGRIQGWAVFPPLICEVLWNSKFIASLKLVLSRKVFFLPIFRVAELWPCSLCISWKLECFLNTLSTNESRTSVEYLNVRSSRMDLEKPSLNVWKKKRTYICVFSTSPQ